MSYLAFILFGSIPVAAIVFAVVSIIRYSSAKKANMQTPETFSGEEIKSRKDLMIVSLIIAGILAAVVIGFVCLMFMAVAYM